MKTLKLLLTAILLMVAYVANAQTIQVYKDGAVVKEYSSAEVDSVVYKPAAAQPRYYYYAGWDCPNSVEELENKGTEIENFKTMSVGTIIRLFDGELTTETRAPYQLLIPNEGVGIYDSEGLARIEELFILEDQSINGYKRYRYNKNTSWIAGVMLKKI